MADNNDLVTVAFQEPAVMTFSNLFEAKAIGKKGKEQGDPKFSITLEPDANSALFADLRKKAAAVAAKKWPGRDLKELKFPWANGDQLADKRQREIEQAKAAGKSGSELPRDREFSRGKAVITARTKLEPGLSYVDGRALVELEDESRRAAAKGKFYAGCEVLVEVALKAYEGVGANPDGVNAYLNKVCSLNRGAKIEGLSGGRTSAADTFKGYLGTTSDYDPTAGGLDDEIPF